MPRVIKTIEQFVCDVTKADTLWICFNTNYNKICLYKEEIEGDLFDKDYTDNVARDEFKLWMKETLPHVKYEDVFDMAPSSFMQWQFLGSCAFEVDIDSPEYKAICDRYEDENGKPKNINAGLYILEYEFAQKLNEERNKMWENEFGDDE